MPEGSNKNKLKACNKQYNYSPADSAQTAQEQTAYDK